MKQEDELEFEKMGFKAIIKLCQKKSGNDKWCFFYNIKGFP